MIILQSDPAWANARAGHVTASRIADMMAKTKTGWGAGRANYAADLVVERLTGAPLPSFQSEAMRWGLETEAHARAAYEFRFDAECRPGGFVTHCTIPWAGASPDGFVGDDGLVEFKCPNTATHIDTLLTGAIPRNYALQMQWQLACADASWCDYVSFDPRLPEQLRLFVRRVGREAVHILELEREVRVFLGEVEEKMERLRAMERDENPTRAALLASLEGGRDD